MVTALKLKNTKKGGRYASFLLEDYDGTIESVVWPDIYQQVHQLLGSEEPIIVQGKAEISEERTALIVENIELFAAVRSRSSRIGRLELRETDPPEVLSALAQLFAKYQGTCSVLVIGDFLGKGRSLVLRNGLETIRVEASEALIEESEQLLGRSALFFY
jgi:DNA polymerase-3 subunit alpha